MTSTDLSCTTAPAPAPVAPGLFPLAAPVPVPPAAVAGAGVGGDDGTAHVGPSPQERAWFEAEAATIGYVSTMNLAAAGLVRAIVGLLATGGWRGVGVRSCAHWVAWKASMSPARARRLVAIAERIDELPACWAAFEAGRLTEDAMVLLARRLPADRDAELARLAPELMISQLSRLLAKLPDLVGEDEATEAPEPTPYLRLHTTDDGWGRGSFLLPPDANERLRIALDHARDAEYEDRTGIDPHPDDPHDSDAPHDPDGLDDLEAAGGDAGAAVRCDEACGGTGERHPPMSSTGDAEPGVADRPRVAISNVDALVRLACEGTHALDAHHRRTGTPGERAKVLLHRDLGPDGTFGPGRLHLGPVVEDPLARYLCCDADVAVITHRGERLVGIHPATRTIPTGVRRAIEDRDQGCVHPLCHQRRHLHIHHIRFWDDGGPTTPDNLVALCPTHHRQLHHGAFHITGNPETGPLTVTDPTGRTYDKPRYGLCLPTPWDPPSPPDGPATPDRAVNTAADAPRSSTDPAPGDRTHPPPDAPYRPPTGERLETCWLSWN